MSDKVIVLMTVVAVFVLLSNATLTGKQEDIKIVVEKKAFFINDYKHDTSMAGDWARKDYVIMMKINFLDLKLNTKQLVKDKKVSGNLTMKPDSNDKTKHGPEPYNSQTCAVNGTHPMNNGTCKPRPHGFTKRTFITCQTTTVTVANWVRNGATWSWNRMFWLAKKTMDGVICLAEWALDTITRLVEKAWDGVILMGRWSWDGVTWFAARIWCGLSWLTSQIWDVITWSGNVIAELYAGYLESHVTYVKACFTGLTWQYGICLVIGGFVVRVSILLLTRTMKVIRQRRIEREAQLAKETAERLAAAARKRKRASILNQKNRHKKKLV